MNKRGRKPKTGLTPSVVVEEKVIRSAYYPREEQETTCVFDAMLNQWIIYSTTRKHLSRLVEKFGKPHEAEYRRGILIAGKWRLSSKAISFRRMETKPRNRKKEEQV